MEAKKEAIDVHGEELTGRPAVDVLETDEAYLVIADMPGVQPDAIDIRLEQDQLEIRGLSAIEGLEPMRWERSFRVVRGLDAEKVRANYALGVLTLTLPKPAHALPRKIQVTSA